MRRDPGVVAGGKIQGVVGAGGEIPGVLNTTIEEVGGNLGGKVKRVLTDLVRLSQFLSINLMVDLNDAGSRRRWRTPTWCL